MSNDTGTNRFPETAIPLSKRKLILMMMGSLAFVAASILLWSIADIQNRRDPLFVKAVAVACGCFSTLCGIYACVAACDSKPGLVIDQDGIIDNASGVAAGRIDWREIIGLRVTEMGPQRFLTIDVVDPQKFINRGGFFRRMLNAGNARMVGSPVNIPSNCLTVDFEELVHLVSAAWEQAQSRLSPERDESA